MSNTKAYDVYLNPPGYTKKWLGQILATDEDHALEQAKSKYYKESPDLLSVEDVSLVD